MIPAPNGVTVGSSIAEATNALPDAERKSGYATVDTTTRNAPSASAANSDGCRSSDAGAFRHTGFPPCSRGAARCRSVVVVMEARFRRS